MATLGVGAKVEYRVGSAWVEIPKIRSMSFPDVTVDAIETTNMGIANYTKTYDGGLIDAGSLSLDYAYTSDVYADLFGLLRVVIRLRITGPEGDPLEMECDALITALSQPFTPAEEAIGTVTFKISDLPEFE